MSSGSPQIAADPTTSLVPLERGAQYIGIQVLYPREACSHLMGWGREQKHLRLVYTSTHVPSCNLGTRQRCLLTQSPTAAMATQKLACHLLPVGTTSQAFAVQELVWGTRLASGEPGATAGAFLT